MKTKKKTSAHSTSTGAFCNENPASDSSPEARLNAAVADIHAAIAELASGRASGSASNANRKSCGHGMTALPEVGSQKPEAQAGPPVGNNPTTFLQTWFEEQQIMFNNFAELVPQLATTELSSADRMRLNGSGVRRYGFIEKTADVAGEFPQFWPAIVGDTGKLKELVGEIEVLRNLFVWFRYLSRVVQDLLLLSGDEAFRLSGAYYAAARDGARRKNPERYYIRLGKVTAKDADSIRIRVENILNAKLLNRV